MCHIASSLSVHIALSSPFRPLHPVVCSPPLLAPFILLLLLLFFSPLLHSHHNCSCFTPILSLSSLALPHSSLAPSSTKCPVYFKCFIFTHILSPSIPMTLSLRAELLLLDGTSAQWRRTLLSPHYPFMEYPLLWWAIFLQSSNDRSLGDPVHLHCNIRHSH